MPDDMTMTTVSTPHPVASDDGMVDERCAEDGQQRLRNGPGDRQKPGPETCNGDDGFSDYFQSQRS